MLVPPRAAKVLGVLLERPGAVVSRDELHARVWADAHVTDSSLTEAIKRLRRVLGDESADPRFIRTVHRRGYCFVGEVREAAEPTRTPRSIVSELLLPDHGEAIRWRRPMLTIIGIGVTVALALSILFLGDLFAWLRATESPNQISVLLDGAPLLSRSPALKVSADGSRLIYGATNDAGPALYERPLNGFSSRRLPGTERASGLFVSPTGDRLGFIQDNELKVLGTGYGTPRSVLDVPGRLGATFAPDNSVLVGTWLSGLVRVGIEDHGVDLATQLDLAAGETAHVWPHMLPDEQHVLFTVWAGAWRRSIAIQNLSQGGPRTILEDASYPVYVDSGHLLFVRDGLVMVVAFDLDALDVAGDPVPLPWMVDTDPLFGTARLSYSSAGVLAFVPAVGAPGNRLVYLTPSGESSGTLSERRGWYFGPRLSPDGKTLAVTVLEGSGTNVWVVDLERQVWRRLDDGRRTMEAIWSPDSQHVAVRMAPPGESTVAVASVHEPSELRIVFRGGSAALPTSWTPDGSTLIVTTNRYSSTPGGQSSATDIYAVGLDGSDPTPIVATEYHETSGTISPDGRGFAFVSNETGQNEVYIQAFPGVGAGAGDRVRVSAGGGVTPFWGGDAQTLFFQSAGGFVRASIIETDHGFAVAEQELLFRTQVGQGIGLGSVPVAFDAARNLFIAVEGRAALVPRRAHVVLNIHDELRRLVTPQHR